MTTPAPIPTTELLNLAARIKAAHEALTGKNVVPRAMQAGEWLKEAKDKLDHGQWQDWLEKNCDLKERTAQRYMKLADNKVKLMEKVRTATRGSKTVTMSDLSISDALKLVNGQSLSERRNSSDKYDKIEEKLIGKLEKMKADEAEAGSARNNQQNHKDCFDEEGREVEAETGSPIVTRLMQGRGLKSRPRLFLCASGHQNSGHKKIFLGLSPPAG